MKSTKNKKTEKQTNKFKIRVLAELYTTRILLYLLFISIQCVIACFLNIFFEMIVILLAYTLLRWCYPKTWHHKKTLYCLLYSFVFFYILYKLVLPIYISLLSGIVLSMLFTYYLYKLQCLIDNAINKTKTTTTIFDLTNEQFYDLLNASTISQEEKDAVEYRVIYHYKGVRWYQAVGYCKRNCQYLYKNGVKKLNQLLNSENYKIK